MTKLLEVYKCDVCGNMTKVVHASGGTMVCCGKPMISQQEKTTDPGKEKHVPVIERSANGIIVKLGSVPHPMEEKHSIEWIEVQDANGETTRWLSPGGKPEAGFCLSDTNVKARAYCNVHGLWTNRP
ncbi:MULTISPECIES: desulfoferrodoxin [unclassified Methanoregula]|uniref:desulfoferrodoxin n=1 Tax=unclassified Methanoregula TaxID=2649730 RepID=UPI0009CB5810|nr:MULTISPECIES: desulfoferrodoxin [unclassified Methanoregula]OPX64919.1 MAG: Superoxide reductase [Methanoregula sp. PtaB.Bin085]OPY32971.1 MAG: Superoxide reductase [Methanoregula sp. PtaU1.Bin006]